MLLPKLLGSARGKWSRSILTIRRRQKREQDLTDFISFVSDETLILSDPIFSKDGVEQNMDDKLNSRRTKPSFATKDDSKVHVGEKVDDCIDGSEGHKLDVCNAKKIAMDVYCQ